MAIKVAIIGARSLSFGRQAIWQMVSSTTHQGDDSTCLKSCIEYTQRKG